MFSFIQDIHLYDLAYLLSWKSTGLHKRTVSMIMKTLPLFGGGDTKNTERWIIAPHTLKNWKNIFLWLF